MLNKIIILSSILSCLYLLSCKDDNIQFKTKRKIFQSDNYVELQYSQSNDPADYADSNKFKIRIIGNVNRTNFKKYFRSDTVGAFDISVWNNEIILAAVQGFVKYSPEKNVTEGIFLEKNITVCSLVKFVVGKN